MAKKIKIKTKKRTSLKDFDIAVQYYQSGNLQQSEAVCRHIVQQNPDHSDALNLLGLIECLMGQHDSAIQHIRRAIHINPGVHFYFNNLGLALAEKNMTDEAIESFNKALMLKTDYVDAYNNLGLALADKGLLDEAIKNFRMALTLMPDCIDSLYNLGNVLSDKGILEEAIRNFRMALILQPDFDKAHNDLAMTYLLAKDFEKGWEEYEWRLKTIKVAPLKKQKWDRSLLDGKIILVYGEQGYGDTIQFMRYLPLLYEAGARKVLFKPNKKGMEKLLGENNLGADMLDPSIPVETLEYDTNIHLLSLPRIFKTNLDNIPFKGKRYLKANPEKVKLYREKFFDPTPCTLNPTPFRIGICWQGSALFVRTKDKSLPLSHFYPLAKLPDVKIYSLQKGYGVEQLNNLPCDIKIVNLGETFNDFSDTAAAIENLDIVITVDTSIVHLAGALGKKTWLLHPPYAEWRWHLDMDNSPWYEDVRLFRHKELGKKDWEEMMQRVVEKLLKDRG